MVRTACWVWMGVAFLLGCQSPERAAIQPLPEDIGPLSYQELVLRAWNQVKAAHEFSFQDNWGDVEQAATALRQSVARLNKLKPDDIPAENRATLAKQLEELDGAAQALQTAAKAKDAAKADEAFQRLNATVRKLRTK